MLRRNFIKHLSGKLACAALLTTPYLAGCATTRVREIEVCLPDPRNAALQCTRANGEQYTRPWDVSAENYACMPLDQLKAYMMSCK